MEIIYRGIYLYIFKEEDKKPICLIVPKQELPAEEVKNAESFDSVSFLQADISHNITTNEFTLISGAGCNKTDVTPDKLANNALHVKAVVFEHTKEQKREEQEKRDTLTARLNIPPIPSVLFIDKPVWDLLCTTVNLDKYPLLLGPKGCGKCIVGNSLIFTNKGLLRIQDISSNRENDTMVSVKENIIVKTEDKLEILRGFYYNGKQPIYKIISGKGFELKGTGVHPILCLGQDGNLNYVQLNKLIDEYGSYKVVIQPANLWADTNYKCSSFPLTSTKKNALLPTVVNEDLALFMGLMVGDGWTNHLNKSKFSFTVSENLCPEIKQFVIQLSEQLFNITPSWDVQKKSQTKTGSLLWYYCDGAKLLLQLGLPCETSGKKYVPHSILQSPKNIQIAFLQGLFETDGFISKPSEGKSIEYSSKSEQLVNEIQLMLLNFGILGTKRKKFNKEFNTNSYSLYLTDSAHQIFCDLIGFLSKKKRQRAKESLLTQYCETKGNIPFQERRTKRIVKEFQTSDYYNFINDKNKVEALRTHLYNTSCLTGKTIEKFSTETLFESTDISYLLNIVKNKYFFDEIDAIVLSEEEEVMDLNIENTHSFNSNGFVSHNTETAYQLAKANNANFYPCNAGAAFKPKQFFVGMMHLKETANGSTETVLVESEFLKAFKSDEPMYIFLDEITRVPQQAENYLMTILDKKQSYIYVEELGLRINRGKGVRFVAAGNMGMQYAGTRTLDGAFADRFQKFIVDYLPPIEEEKLVMQRAPECKAEEVRELIKWANIVRDEEKTEALSTGISTRQLIDMAHYLEQGFSLNEVKNNLFLTNFINGNNEVEQVKALLQQV